MSLRGVKRRSNLLSLYIGDCFGLCPRNDNDSAFLLPAKKYVNSPHFPSCVLLLDSGYVLILSELPAQLLRLRNNSIKQHLHCWDIMCHSDPLAAGDDSCGYIAL